MAGDPLDPNRDDSIDLGFFIGDDPDESCYYEYDELVGLDGVAPVEEEDDDDDLDL